MPLEKTSKAVIKSARINPSTSKEAENALKIIARLEADGWTFSQIVIDAINRADGATPEMFPHTDLSREGIEKLLEQFADMLVSRIGQGKPIVPSDDEIKSGKLTPFEALAAKKLADRSKQIKG